MRVKLSSLKKLIGSPVVVSHWSDAKLEDATKLGILSNISKDGYFYIEGDNRGYKYCRMVSICPYEVDVGRDGVHAE